MSEFKNVAGSRKSWLAGWGYKRVRNERRAIERAFRQTARGEIASQLADAASPDPETVRQAAIRALCETSVDLGHQIIDLEELRDWFLDRDEEVAVSTVHMLHELQAAKVVVDTELNRFRA